MFQRALMTRGTLFSWNYSKPRGTSCCFDLFISHWDSLSLKFHAMKLSSPFLSNLLKGCQSGTSPEHRVSRKLSSFLFRNLFQECQRGTSLLHHLLYNETIFIFPLKCRIKESRNISKNIHITKLFLLNNSNF